MDRNKGNIGKKKLLDDDRIKIQAHPQQLHRGKNPENYITPHKGLLSNKMEYSNFKQN